MHIKRILILIALLSTLLFTVSAADVQNSDIEEVIVNGNIITIHSEEFKIPEGFEFKGTTEMANGIQCLLTNSNSNENLVIGVSYKEEYSESELLSSSKDDEIKTINNHKGLYKKNQEDVMFSYVDNNNTDKKDYYIVITTNGNEELINEVII